MIEPNYSWIVSDEQSGYRLDRFLALKHPEHSRSRLSALIEQGQVTITGKIIQRAAHRVRAGDIVSFTISPAPSSTLEPDPSVSFEVVYEDQDLLVINKPPGLVVHPGAGNRSRTLAHGILAHLGLGLADGVRPGIVHRLDKDTSGLMVVAKNDTAQTALVRQFKPPRQIERLYLALVERLPALTTSMRPLASDATTGASLVGVVNAPIGRSGGDRRKMVVGAKGGREAVTYWSVRERFSCGALLELKLETGRTHQIRVHLKSIGAPIVGDPTYGGSQNSRNRHSRGVGGSERGKVSKVDQLQAAARRFGRQALHAYRLSFLHPTTGLRMQFTSDLPQDMAELIELYRQAGRCQSEQG